jgi:Methyltransferase domain
MSATDVSDAANRGVTHGRASALLARGLARSTWQPDMWDRLLLVAQCVGPATSVLDVGGRGHQLARFMPGATLLTANIEPPADVIVDPRTLPFADAEFDVVTSCDVIEHMPAERRADHIAELARVARRRLVLCCPYGSPEKNAAEQEIADTVMRDLGRTFPYLEEHIKYGFPSEEEVVAMVRAATPNGGVRCLYYGDYPSGNAMLLDGVRARYGYDPRALVRFVGNAYVRPRRPTLDVTAGPTTARLYVIADLPV